MFGLPEKHLSLAETKCYGRKPPLYVFSVGPINLYFSFSVWAWRVEKKSKKKVVLLPIVQKCVTEAHSVTETQHLPDEIATLLLLLSYDVWL